MKIIHHNDNDGYCSAAVVNAFLTDMFNNPSENDFFVYSYSNKDFNVPEVVEKETVYIVDVALDDRIFAFIEHCVSAGANVIHIDHHQATLDYMESHDIDSVINQITAFYEIGVSASLMTFAYSCMNDSDRKTPGFVNWGDNEAGNRLMMYGNAINIPLSIQYVNDYDVWNWKFGKDTSYFQLGLFMAPYNNKPHSKEWLDLVMNDSLVTQIMVDGEIAYRYRERLYGIALNKGFIANVDGKAWCCVNSDFADSQLYGEYAEQFAVCCAFQYYGDNWVYHIRSAESSNVDVNEIAKSHGGGGHKHAAGFHDDGEFYNELISKKIKTMHDFIEAYKEAKRQMEEEAKREEAEKERIKQERMREKFLKGLE